MRTRWGATPFNERAACHWLWQRLQRSFSQVAAAIIMPNHFHCLAVLSELGPAINELTRALARMPGTRWESPPPPEPVRDQHHLLRQIRYVLLNPCRKRLCADPLEWEWSTYRDVLGLTAQPWVGMKQLQSWMKQKEVGSIPALHSYLSGDPSVAIAGTAPPSLRTSPSEIWLAHPRAVEAAARHYSRSPKSLARDCLEISRRAIPLLVDVLEQPGPRVARALELPFSTLYGRRERAGALPAAEQSALLSLIRDPRFLRKDLIP